jgi:hypothetical protein
MAIAGSAHAQSAMDNVPIRRAMVSGMNQSGFITITGTVSSMVLRP